MQFHKRESADHLSERNHVHRDHSKTLLLLCFAVFLFPWVSNKDFRYTVSSHRLLLKKADTLRL